jgi:hypothetical protein
MTSTQCELPPLPTAAPAGEPRRPVSRLRPSVIARRVAQQSQSAVRAQIVRVRRAQFGLTHVDRLGIPEARLASGLEKMARAASSVRAQRLNIAIDQILIGGEPEISAAHMAAELGEPLHSSTRLVDGPLAELIRRYQNEGDRVLDADSLRETALYNEATVCRRLTGSYHGAASDDDVLTSLGTLARGGRPSTGPVLVRKVKHSRCYQLLSTGTKVAGALANHEASLDVEVLPLAVTTPLQDLLIRMSWLAGDRQLYQPIDAPEVADWPLVRQCRDRLELMRAFLDGPQAPPVRSYLDVASCYGWFVAQMLEQGYDAFGVERDDLAVQCGEWAYNLDPARVTSSDAEPFLQGVRQRFDAVSCFSLLHHSVIEGEEVAVRLIQSLDAATGQVLFLDTGEEHETWLRNVLPGWNPEFIAHWIEQHTTFAQVIPLGTDRDRRPPNGDNYGRTLFACIRSASV